MKQKHQYTIVIIATIITLVGLITGKFLFLFIILPLGVLFKNKNKEKDTD
jgi:hypothetical protein